MDYACPKCGRITRDPNVMICSLCGSALASTCQPTTPEADGVKEMPAGSNVVSLLTQTRLELGKARGSSQATRQVLSQYLREGIYRGLPGSLLIKYLLFWPNRRDSIFSRVGYTRKEAKEFIGILKELTPLKILQVHETEIELVNSSRSAGTAGNDIKGLMVEARARIIWGESLSSVESFLTAKGVSSALARLKTLEFMEERKKEIRCRGIRFSVLGSVLIGLEGITFLPCYNYLNSNTYTGGALLVAAFTIGGLYGLWKLTVGVAYLFFPQWAGNRMSNLV